MGALVGLAAELAVCNVVVGGLVAWGFSGGDGRPRNVIAPLLGVGVFAGTIAALVATLGALHYPALVGFLGVAVAGSAALMWWYARHDDDRVRRQAYPLLAAVLIGLPLVLGLLEGVAVPSGRRAAIAAVAPALMLLSLPFVRGLAAGGPRDDVRQAAAVVALLAAPPALLAVALLAA